MPQEVVNQVHRLARRAKAKKKLTFTNRKNEDLDVPYADLVNDENDEDVPATPQDGAPAGVEDDESDDDDSTYVPPNDTESDSESNDD